MTDVSFVTGGGSGNQVATWLSNGDGTFRTVGQTIYGDLGSPPSALWTPVTGDFIGNGNTDVAFISGSTSGNSIATLLAEGPQPDLLTFISSQTKTVGSVTVSSVANTYGTLTSSTTPALPWDASNIAPWFPFISKSVVSGSDLNGAALPTTTTTYTYDSYGDPLTIAISKMLGSTQGPTQTTTNTYQTPNTTVPNWRFGKVITSQVVSTTP
jgi:hypothetical protein